MNNAFGAPKSGNDTEILEFLKRPRTWVKAALFFTHLVALSTQGKYYKSHVMSIFLLILVVKHRDNIE